MYNLDLLGFRGSLPPVENKIFEVYAGSYGRKIAGLMSDVDIVAVYVPDYDDLYGHLVPGFGTKTERFKAFHTPDYMVKLNAGMKKVDVTAFDVVHFFNLLLKGSPNHVEYLFLEPGRKLTEAGSILLANRDLFVTQTLVTKLIAAGKHIMLRESPHSIKDYMLATRFFIYAVHAYSHGTLMPELTVKLMREIRDTNDWDYAQMWAKSFYEHVTQLVETKDTFIPKETSEELANEVLLQVLHAHWNSRAKENYDCYS